MVVTMDALTAATLKHLRDSWWDDEFTEFLAETLRPRPGNRILDVGCGAGVGELSIGRLQLSQLRLYGVDNDAAKVVTARATMRAHNQRARFAGGDVVRLPFRDAVFDSTFCVAVLQHVADVGAAVSELARVTVRGGRLVAVEPDNRERYFFSSTPLGRQASEAAVQLFAAMAAERGDAGDASPGPKLPGIFATHGVEPLDVRLFPVSRAQLGTPPDAVWRERVQRVQAIVDTAPTPVIRSRGLAYLDLLAGYQEEARAAGASFVEVQSTLLFATVGQRL